MSQLDIEAAMAHRRVAKAHEYSLERLQLYGVGVGLGFEPTDERQLAYLRDQQPAVLPTFATVAAWDIEFLLELGIDWSKLIHASQTVTLEKPLPPSGRIVADSCFESVHAKPERRSTIFCVASVLRDAESGEALARLRHTALARDFEVAGAPTGSPERLPNAPGREPDFTVNLPTSPQVALIYRLLGGRSQIHFDPETARAQGFERPIMHGLSTFGHACHALLRGCCDYDADAVRSFAADFSAPALPGDELETAFWREGSEAFFETRVRARGVTVLKNGHARLG